MDVFVSYRSVDRGIAGTLACDLAAWLARPQGLPRTSIPVDEAGDRAWPLAPVPATPSRWQDCGSGAMGPLDGTCAGKVCVIIVIWRSDLAIRGTAARQELRGGGHPWLFAAPRGDQPTPGARWECRALANALVMCRAPIEVGHRTVRTRRLARALSSSREAALWLARAGSRPLAALERPRSVTDRFTSIPRLLLDMCFEGRENRLWQALSTGIDHSICLPDSRRFFVLPSFSSPPLAAGNLSTSADVLICCDHTDLSPRESGTTVSRLNSFVSTRLPEPGANHMPPRKTPIRGPVQAAELAEVGAVGLPRNEGHKRAGRAGETGYGTGTTPIPSPGGNQLKANSPATNPAPRPNGNDRGGGSDSSNSFVTDVSQMSMLELYWGPERPDGAPRRSLSQNLADLERERAAGNARPADRAPSLHGSINGLYHGGSKLIH